MLTFQTYKLLNQIKRLKKPYILETPKSPKFYGQVFISDYELFNYEYFKDMVYEDIDIKVPREQLNYLINEGYINLVSNDKLIEVTHKGLHHWQISIIDFCKFLARSVITPIVVSVITAYLTVLFTK